jgi:tetratricopeptide (TPR) repeat protein
MSDDARQPLLYELYQKFLQDQDSGTFVERVHRRYSVGTLERLARSGQRLTRRAAVLALGFLGEYDSNPALGLALSDPDRGVRTLADNGIRSLWCRAGDDDQRRRLATIIRLNATHRYEEAIRRSGDLIQRAPALAEAWNQRAIALFHTGRYAESICDCRQALELNPYHFGAAAGMGQCHLSLHDGRAALECFRRALRLNPGLEGVRAQVNYLQRSLKSREEELGAGE